MPREFFRIVGLTGTGAEDDPVRPRNLNASGITGWAACYKTGLVDRAIVCVLGTQAALDVLAKRVGVLRLGTLAELRDNVGTLRTTIRENLRTFSGCSVAEWYDTMIGEWRGGD